MAIFAVRDACRACVVQTDTSLTPGILNKQDSVNLILS